MVRAGIELWREGVLLTPMESAAGEAKALVAQKARMAVAAEARMVKTFL